MVYSEFRIRCRALGIKLTSVAEEFGISRRGIYQWKVTGVPRYAVYWLLWREEGVRRLRDIDLLDELREILGGRDDSACDA